MADIYNVEDKYAREQIKKMPDDLKKYADDTILETLVNIGAITPASDGNAIFTDENGAILLL